MNIGEPLSLQVVIQLIKLCNFSEVEVWDPHSDVLVGMFEPGTLVVKTQVECLEQYISLLIPNSFLVSPDAGALKKIYKLAKQTKLPVIEASKIRDVKTGEITGTKIDFNNVDTYYRTSGTGKLVKPLFIIVDDICDGGRTFIELAKEIRKVYGRECNIQLVVTHGIFSKGLSVFSGLIDRINAKNNISNLNLIEYNKENTYV